MSPREVEPRRCVIERGPDVQLLGDAVLIRGAAAIDAHRLLVRGIETVRRNDAIAPPPRLLQAVAALKVAADAARCSFAARSDEHANVPNAALRGPWTSEELGSEEVAHVLGVTVQHVRRLGPQLGGRRRGKRWVFSRAAVEAYLIERKEQETA